MKKILTLIIILANICLFAQKTYTHIALFGGSAHIGNGAVIESSIIVIKNALIIGSILEISLLFLAVIDKIYEYRNEKDLNATSLSMQLQRY